LAAADGLRALTLFGVAAALIPSSGGIGAVAARLASRMAGLVLVLIALRRR
jgi:hypothetical protein